MSVSKYPYGRKSVMCDSSTWVYIMNMGVQYVILDSQYVVVQLQFKIKKCIFFCNACFSCKLLILQVMSLLPKLPRQPQLLHTGKTFCLSHVSSLYLVNTLPFVAVEGGQMSFFFWLIGRNIFSSLRVVLKLSTTIRQCPYCELGPSVSFCYAMYACCVFESFLG